MKLKLMSTFEKVVLIGFTVLVGVSLVAITIGILQRI